MKLSLLYLLLLPVLLNPVVAAEDIKQFTIDDYLQQQKIKAEKQGREANHLIYESSPYLLQHAYNPVAWYGWGEEAFSKAKKENKPIFLSIGYSTCHWCHVMAHESFENEEIAALLNKYFISIKVDREQRPDIDTVYMSATQLINGHGGWPMTVFLDHQLRPFHAATYYPPFSTANGRGLKEVLLKIHALWTGQPELIDEVASNVTANITASSDETTAPVPLRANINALVMLQIAARFDEEMGGFSGAPKFPRPGIFAYLNQLSLAKINTIGLSSKRSSANDAKRMMKTTLEAMAAGGIYDQVAGGFHRYSVDENWQVPHFEKMLYSQALMVIAYSDYYQLVAQDKYKNIVFETLNFVTQEMLSPEAGFYSALDADSERADDPGVHAEGAYYLWSQAELKNILSEDEFKFIKQYFHIRKNGNIDSDPQQEFTNLNIFYIDEDYRDDALSKQQIKILASAKKKLNQKRRLRPRPHLDDKIITAWNGMMLAAFAKASHIFEKPEFLAQARQTLVFIKKNLYDRKNKKLFRQYRAGTASSEATLSDYAWLIYGLLEVYQVDKDKQWLDWAFELQKNQNALFLDKATGAYFESVASDASLLFRSKSIYDGALPAANAIALSNLRALAQFSKPALKKVYSTQAEKLVSSFAAVVNQNPAAASMFLSVEVQNDFY